MPIYASFDRLSTKKIRIQSVGEDFVIFKDPPKITIIGFGFLDTAHWSSTDHAKGDGAHGKSTALGGGQFPSDTESAGFCATSGGAGLVEFEFTDYILLGIIESRGNL